MLVLNLRGHGRNTGAAIGCDLGRLWAYVDAATATVVGDAVDGRVVHDDCAVVDVRDPRDIDVVDGAVVVEVMTLPVATVIAVTGIAIAIVNSAVEADVRTPEAAMQDVAATEEAPVGGSPKCTVEGRSAPCAGNPVVADGCICPVAGGPEIVGRGGLGLLVDGKRRRGLVGLFDGLLTGVYLRIVVVGRGVVVVVVVAIVGLSCLSCGIGLILRRGCSLGSVLLSALLGLSLGTNAEDPVLGSRCWLLWLAVVDRCHVGVGGVGA